MSKPVCFSLSKADNSFVLRIKNAVFPVPEHYSIDMIQMLSTAVPFYFNQWHIFTFIIPGGAVYLMLISKFKW